VKRQAVIADMAQKPDPSSNDRLHQNRKDLNPQRDAFIFVSVSFIHKFTQE